MDAFKTIVWDNLINAALGSLFAAFPVLAWPPLKFLITTIIKKFMDIFYEGIREWVGIKQIIMNNLKVEREYDRAGTKLVIMEREHGLESPEYLQAIKEESDAFSKFIKFSVARK